eukprot:8666900-Karenia_brevis.AAC.1
MKDANGNRKTQRADIANIFANFYAQLYSTTSDFAEPELHGHETFTPEVLAEAFSLLLRGDADVPEAWFVNKLVVLFKKGDAQLPKNYRPISVIPVLAKLFSIILLNRVRDKLDALQPLEQAGFRPGFSCNDEV